MATTLTLNTPVGYVEGVNIGSLLVGYSSNQNNVLRYSFKTPSNGIVTSLTFKSTFRYENAGNNLANYYIRFKVTDSSTSHINAGEGFDYDASITVTGLADVEKSVTISGLSLTPNKTYYIYLFPGETYHFLRFCYDNNGNDLSTLTAEVTSGLVYIDNGTTFEAYQVYIDNGTSWDLYMPYIDNGTSWDLYG